MMKLTPGGVAGSFCPLGIMRASFSFKLFLVTIAALIAGYYLITSVSIGGLMPYNFTAADVIGHSCPFHIVPVTWVSGNDQFDILFRWSIDETRARLAALLALWMLMVSILSWQYLRGRRHTA
ncbi:MAG TPA: hypothetical protein VGN23_07595 [Verrucomicrobiae bacterium]|jgi:hypothetical protein